MLFCNEYKLFLGDYLIDNYLIAILFVCIFFFVLSPVLTFNFPLGYQIHCPLMLIFSIWD